MYLQNENSHFSEEITSNIVVQTNKVMFLSEVDLFGFTIT